MMYAAEWCVDPARVYSIYLGDDAVVFRLPVSSARFKEAHCR